MALRSGVEDIRAGAARKAPAPAVVYPDRIRLSPGAERYLNQLGVDLVLGGVEAWQLPPSLLQLFTFAYEEGKASRQGEIDALHHEANRLYVEMCRRTPPRQDHQSFGDLSRIRGDFSRANRHDERMAQILRSPGLAGPDKEHA